MEKATFGAGCFWGVQARFEQVPGVVETAVGYEGGSIENPTYKDVCSDRTGHVEVVELSFDPQKVSYAALLDLFFELHDPTEVNRQGPDWGTQYRTVVFFHSPEQETAARDAIARLDVSHKYAKPIATQVVPATTFWRAEEYHQKYLEKRGAVSCHI
jgi:peptide-methionine (S)-S-oxide reductase